MELVLQRESDRAGATHGLLTSSYVRCCETLEPTAMMVPAGRYGLELYASKHFKRIVPLLKNVPGRDYIEIHAGNEISASTGCIIVGLARTAAGVCNCEPAVDFIVRLISLAAQRAEKSWINIIDAKKAETT